VGVVGIYYPPELTGIAPYNAGLAEALIEAGASVHVITGVPHFPMWKTQAPFNSGLRFEDVTDHLRVSRRRHWVPREASLLGRAMLESTFFFHATPTVVMSRADVIVAVTPSLSGLAAAELGRRRRPLGVIVQDLIGGGAAQTGTTGSRAANAINRIERRLLRRADQVGVISPDFVGQMIDAGVRADRISVVPNFTHINPVEVTAKAAKSVLGWDPDIFTVVHTGNMGLKQGLHHVIDAAREAEVRGDSINWMLVGDGNQRHALEERARGVTSVRFVDPLPEATYPFALAAADVLLLNESPGVVEFCLPSKLTSYVVSGRPILAATEPTSVTYRTVSRNGLADLVLPGDPIALLDGLERLRAQPDLVEQLLKAAASYASSNSPADAAERYVEFVRKMTNAV
jgi:colanic acid biosynthesis glycosyl transferase WcaI